jgi:F0F1-type ATP synthase assembly protein I
MPKIDQLKADIAFHEKLFFAALASVFALTGWMTAHYTNGNHWLLLLAFVVTICAGVFSVLQYRKIKQLIEEIGEC